MSLRDKYSSNQCDYFKMLVLVSRLICEVDLYFYLNFFLSNPIHGSWLNKNKSISQFILTAVIYKCSII